MKVVCIAEKPSISKAVAGILSGGRPSVRDTRNKYIKNYDFTYRFPSWGDCHVTFSCVMGHLMEIDFEPAYKSWQSCPPAALFEARIVSKVGKDQKGVYDNIVSECARAEILFIWTDCDREGEHIGSEVMGAARQKNPNIRIYRANFNNLERAHIIQAARNPVALDLRAAAAVDARQELDLRLGAAFTRFQTLQLQQAIQALADQIISYGSCQFPTLGFVVDRWRRVQNFRPETFWSIKVSYVRDDIDVEFTWKRGRLFDQLAVVLMFERCLESGMARVASVIRKPTSKWRPLPLTTVELQKQGARFLGMSSKKVMDIAEKLYNNGFLSYPRTETDQFDPGMNLRALVEKQVVDQQWGTYAQKLLDGDYRAPRNGRNNDKAHPPIHPIAHVAPHALRDRDEHRVYEFVVRRFLACVSEDAKGESSTVDLEYGGERFSTSGLIVLARNYLDVYPYDRWTSSRPLPAFTQGELIPLDTANVTEGETSSPSLLTESELIGLMDANGIGTDATMADHIEKVCERGYVFKRPKGGGGRGGRGGGRGRGRGRGAANGDNGGGGTGGGGITEFVPSNLGVALVEAYDTIAFDASLTKPFLRKEMEEKMRAICDGRKTRQEVVHESLEQYREVFVKANREVGVLKEACRRYLEV